MPSSLTRRAARGGRLRHLYRGSEHDCAPRAVEQVRAFGGVLEHPVDSRLWPACAMPRPGELPDAWDGFTIAVDQCAWGHVARKPTWLYVVGAPRGAVAGSVLTGGTPTHAIWYGKQERARLQAAVEAGIRTGGTPTHWASGSRVNPDRPSSRQGSPVPPGIKVCSAQQRRRTPPAFAAWLVSIAAMARK